MSVCKGVVGEDKLVPLYGKGRSVTGPRILPNQKVSCGGRTTYQGVSRRGRPAYQGCRVEYRADAEQRIKKLRADAEQCINEFRARCRVETVQSIKECFAETEQRIKECRVEYGAVAGQRIKECGEEAEQRIYEFRAWLHHRSHPQECPVCKGVVGEEKLVPLYGKGRSVTGPRMEIPPRPSDIHTLFASLEQMRLSREATEQRFKEYIDQCIEEFCVAQEQRIALLQEAQERRFQQLEQRIKECRAEADQRIRECRAEYRADAEQRIKKLRADAEQCINEFRAECRLETEQRIKECRAETEQRIKECRVEYGAAAGQRIKECREEAEQRINEFRAVWGNNEISDCTESIMFWLHHRSHPQECPVCKGVVGEEKLVPLYGKGRSVTDPRMEIPPRPSDIHTLFASLEQMRLSREATEQRFKEYIDQCIEEFCVAQEQRIALLQEAQERRFQQLECQQRINEFRVETEHRIKECRAETKQRIKECRVEYGAAVGQRIKECREEVEQRINEFRADPVITLCGHLFFWPCLYKWLHHRSHPQECPVCKGVVGEEKLVPLFGKGRSVTDPRTEIPPRPSDIHTLFASLEQTRLSREATEQRFKEYIDQCIEEFCVAQEQRIALLQEAQERRFQQLLCRIKECRADADYRIKKECRGEYRADAEHCIEKLRADAEQCINEFRAECRMETEQRIKECHVETEQRIKECRVEYGAAAGQRIKECREEAEQRINEFRAVWGNNEISDCTESIMFVGEPFQ
ncbi:hypothetical protein KIW84_024702 [Lathyrus oleraceus]|uniref:E3 ubiquitin-protein ligase RMA n=1 Tax=Pisum sativum TaxID=3888 RepID=A0A9D5BCJ6_PEA|nr:hypothetical protein KIW84_024702 [Pisum sativum]